MSEGFIISPFWISLASRMSCSGLQAENLRGENECLSGLKQEIFYLRAFRNLISCEGTKCNEVQSFSC